MLVYYWIPFPHCPAEYTVYEGVLPIEYCIEHMPPWVISWRLFP